MKTKMIRQFWSIVQTSGFLSSVSIPKLKSYNWSVDSMAHTIPLETNRFVLTWLCVYPADESTSKWQKMVHFMFGLAVFTANSLVFIVSISFFAKNVSIDLEEALFALIQMAGSGNILYVSIISYISRHKITTIFNSLSKIYESCKETLTFGFETKNIGILLAFCYTLFVVWLQAQKKIRYDFYSELIVKVKEHGRSTWSI